MGGWGLQAHCADLAQDVKGILLETLGVNDVGTLGNVLRSLRGTVH